MKRLSIELAVLLCCAYLNFANNFLLVCENSCKQEQLFLASNNIFNPIIEEGCCYDDSEF